MLFEEGKLTYSVVCRESKMVVGEKGGWAKGQVGMFVLVILCPPKFYRLSVMPITIDDSPAVISAPM